MPLTHTNTDTHTHAHTYSIHTTTTHIYPHPPATTQTHLPTHPSTNHRAHTPAKSPTLHSFSPYGEVTGVAAQALPLPTLRRARSSDTSDAWLIAAWRSCRETSMSDGDALRSATDESAACWMPASGRVPPCVVHACSMMPCMQTRMTRLVLLRKQ